MAMKAQADAGGKRKPQKIKQDQKKANSAVSTQAQKKVFADAKRENVLRESQAAASQKQGAALKTWAEAKQSDPFADLNLQAMKRQFGDSKRAAALQTAAPGVKSAYDGVDFNTKRLNIAKQRQINALKDLESSTGKVKQQESAVRNLNPALNYYVRSTQQKQAAKLDRLAREYGSASTPEAADRIRTEYDKKYSEYLKLNQSSQKAYSDAVNNLRESYAEADRNFQKAKDADEQYQSLLRNADTSSGASAGVSSDMKRRDQAWLQSAEQHMQELDRKISEKEQEKSVKVPEMQYSQGANAGFELLDKYDADIKALQQERQEYADYVELNKKYGAVKYEKDFDKFSRYQSTADKPFHFDTLYEYVNGNTDAYAEASAMEGADSEISVVLKQMTEDEKGTYNYLYAKKGSKAASTYLKELRSALNARNRVLDEQKIAEFSEKHPIAATVGAVAVSPLKGFGYIGQAVDYLTDGKIDQNASYNRLSYGTNTATGTVAQKIERELGDKWGKVGSFGYQTGVSMLNFLTTLLVSKGIGAGAGMGSEAVSNLSLALMGSGAAADTVISAKDRGLSDSQAFTLGTIAGAAEIVTEKVSIEALLDKVSLGENKLWYFLKNTLSEGSEEVGSDIINLTADVLISRDKSEWSQAIKAYREQNPKATEGEAFAHALADQAQQMGLDFLGGAASGGIMAGGALAVSGIQNSVENLSMYKDAVQNGKAYYALNQLTRGELARQNGDLDIEQDYKNPAKSPEVTRLLRQQGLDQSAIDSLLGRQNAAAEYSIDPEFAGDVAAWDKSGRPAEKRFVLGSTGAVLQGLGAIENDIYMNGDKINTILQTHPEMTLNEIQRLPEILEDPVLILKSRSANEKGENSRLVVFGSVKAKNGIPIMTVLDLHPNENGFVINDMQKVSSAYAKDKNVGRFFEQSDVLYADKKRAATLLRHTGQSITGKLLRYGSMGSISYDNGKVNIEGVPFSSLMGDGREFKDITKIENITQDISSSYGKNPKSTFLRDTSINSIPTSTKKVNGKSFLSLRGLDPVAAGQMQRRMAAAKTDFEKSVVRWNVSPEKANAVSNLNGKAEVVFAGTLKGNVNGYYQEGVIHLNPKLSSQQAVLSVFGHELTHSLEKTGAYQDFMEFALSQIGNKTAVQNAVNEKMELYRRNGVELDTTGAMRELVAEYASERLFSDEQTVRRLAQEKPSLAKKILSWIRETLAKLKNDTEKAELLRAERLYSRMLREVENGRTQKALQNKRQFAVSAESEKIYTQQFKRWFGDWQNDPAHASKVVDEDGKPLVVYHGTNAEFNTFQSEYGSYWFSESEDYAEAMMEERGGNRIVEAYVDIKNPYYATLEPDQFTNPIYETPIIRKARSEGHDGAIITVNDNDPLVKDTFYVAFSPEQIKSATDNVGTFDKTNPDIRFSISEDRESFTPERLEKGIEKAARMDSVANITGVPFEPGKGLREKVLAFIRSQGEVRNSELGEVAFTGNGLRSDISHGMGPEKAASYLSVPEVIRQGQVVDYQRNWKGRGYDTAVIVAPVTMNGEPFMEAVVLTRSLNENRFYLHEVLAEKEGGAIRSTAGAAKATVPNSGNAPSINTILQRVIDVKRNGKQYSISESPAETDLEKQNHRLLAENERLKRELTLTEKKEPSPGRVRGTAQSLLKGYSSKLELPKLYDSLKSLYEFILNGKQKKKGVVINYSFEAAKAEALNIARDILNRSTLRGNSEYKELRSLIRNTRIAVPENIRSDLGETYQDFREAHRDMRFANDGVSVEDLWKTLEEGYPGLFDSKVYSNPADMLLRIAEVMDATKPFEYNPYESGEADFDTEAEYLANDILERFHTVPERAPTFADRQARKLLKAQQDADRKMLNLTEKMKREKLDAEKKLARLQEDVEAEKEERARKAKAEREHKAIRELQKETLATLQWLSKNRRKAPADLREKFNEVLADIDLYATHMANPEHWSGKYGTDWAHLADMYEDAKKSDPNFLPSPELDKIVSRLDNKKIFEMDVSALQDLYKAAVGLETEFYNRNKLLGMKQEMETGHMARQSIEDMREAKGNVTKTKTQQFFNEQQLTPMNYLLRMAGWNQDSDFYKMAKQLERGERQVKDYEVRAKRMLESFVKKHKAWLKKADGQGRGATWYKLEVPELQELHMGDKPVFGDTVTVYMTPVQKVHLYLESLNYDNLRHMTGGRTFANKELYSRGKRQKAFEEGTTVRLAPETVKHIVSDLTEEEMALAKALQPYYNEYAAKRINEVSNTLYGYDKAMTKDYAPIYTNANYNKGDFGVYDLTAEGVGNMKERIHGRNPSLNIGALDAFERHVKQTARFVGMAIPARNWTNLMNWQDRNRSFKDEITHRWGLEAKEYIEKLVTDLQGGAIGENGFLESLGNKVLSHYVSAVFGANPGIVFKQAASFPQFAASLGWVNMPKNPIKLIKAAPNELIDAYTSELAYRELGYSTPETAQIKNNPGPLESNKALKFLFAGGSITAMDAGTVKRGWVWAENKVKREYPNLEKGTSEQIKAGESPFYKKVAQEFEDAVALTQPMYDTMHRANIMKNQKGLGKAVTMFRTVPTQIYNLLRRNFGVLEFENGNYQKAKKSGNKAWIQQAKARKRKAARSAAGAISALLISNLLLEGIEFLNQLWKNGAKKYKDDDDELTAESFLKQFGKGYVSDLAGTVIFGKELTEFLFNVLMGERWDGIQMPGGEQLNDLIDSVREGGESILKFVGDGVNLVQNGGSLPEYLRRHGADYAGAAKTIAEKLSMYLGGFPAENIEKYIMGTIRCFSPELAAAAEGIMKAPEKSELDSLHGNALKRKIQDIFENRGIHISDGALEALYVLYEDGYRDSMPGNTPKSVTVDDEQRELTAAQAQTYDLKWKEIIGNNVNRLTGTAEFQEADADDQERMLDKLYDYATAKAKKAVFPEMEITNIKLDKADAMASAFGSAAGWAAWEVMSANVNSAEKRELLLGLSLPDDQKRAIYELDISDKQGEQIDALEAAELGFDDFLDIQSTYALYNAEDSKASEKALEFSRWVDEQGYTEEQEKVIRDNFVFFAMSPAQESNYDKFTSAGLSEDKAYQLHTELADLDPLEGADKVTEAQKLAWTAFSSDYSSDEKYQALSVLMGDSYAKLQSAKEQGIGVEAFMDFYINRTAIKADKDEDGKSLSGKKDGSKQHKIGTYIDQITGLTPEQKDYLYKTIYKTGSNLDRTPWHGGAPYTGDLPEHYAVNQNAAQPAPEKQEPAPEKQEPVPVKTTPAAYFPAGSPSGNNRSSPGGSTGKTAASTGAKGLTLPMYPPLGTRTANAKPRALSIKMPTVPKLISNAQRSADVRRIIMAGGKAVNTTSEALRRTQDGKLAKI